MNYLQTHVQCQQERPGAKQAGVSLVRKDAVSRSKSARPPGAIGRRWSPRGDQSQSGAFPGFESPQPSYRGSIRDQRSGRGEWVSAQEPNQTTLRSSTIVDNLGIWPDLPISSKEPSIC